MAKRFSKQLGSDGQLQPCPAPQGGGFTLEAELGIPKVLAHAQHLGWEVKQFAVEDYERIESAKPITLMTPEGRARHSVRAGLCGRTAAARRGLTRPTPKQIEAEREKSLRPLCSFVANEFRGVRVFRG